MDRVAQEGKMKEKENEITDLADCTNHAYHVLWLARRIQHLWITVAIIVHELHRGCDGVWGWEESCGLCVTECVSASAYTYWVSASTQVCFSWHCCVLETQGEDDKRKLRERLLFTSSVHPGWVAHSRHSLLTEASFTIVITLFIYPTCFWW